MFSSGSESLIHNDVLRILVELALLAFAFVWGLREGRPRRSRLAKARAEEVAAPDIEDVASKHLDRTAL